MHPSLSYSVRLLMMTSWINHLEFFYYFKMSGKWHKLNLDRINITILNVTKKKWNSMKVKFCLNIEKVQVKAIRDIFLPLARCKYCYWEVLLSSQMDQMLTIPKLIPHPSRRLKVLQQPTLQTRSGKVITLKIQTNLILSFCEARKWQCT